MRHVLVVARRDIPKDGIVPIAENRRARHEFEIDDTIECGLELLGTEVKSLRQGKVNFADAYAMVKGNEVVVIGLHIAPFTHGTHENHDETRTRRLLLHASEIERLTKETRERGASLVPLKLYFKKGWAKMLLGVAHGRSKIDKRAVIKKREADRDLRRALTRD
jgi:SsrA-binding protein